MVSVASPTSLTVTTPASSPGLVNVSIHNPDGNSASLSNAFTYGIPPGIQQQPLSQSVVLGSNMQFLVQATGQGTLSYQWQFNGANLLNLGGISGVQTPTLNISNVVQADGGAYQVVISNAFGVLVSTQAVLTVLTLPTVSTPQSLAVGAGANASFSVVAGGTSPYSYQWYQGTNLLGGATNPILNFSSVQSSNQGTYTVLVTNIVGAVTSQPAPLTVLGYCASAQAAQSLYPAGRRSPSRCRRITAATSRRSATARRCSGFTTAAPAGRSVHHRRGGEHDGQFHAAGGEVGPVQYAAALPGLTNPAAQGSFTLLAWG